MKYSAILLLLSMVPRAYAQRSPNIRVNSDLVKDLQDAAASLHLDGAVVIGDTVSVDEGVELRSMSLFIYCNFLQNGAAGIKLNPYAGDTTFNTDGTGLPGRDLTIYSRLPVKASLQLPGGAGNVGKSGRNGKDGKKPAKISECCTQENRGQAGQPGGNGFAGGNGGKIIVRSLAPLSQSQVSFSRGGDAGGTGGPAGAGGTGGTTYWLYAAPGHPDSKRILTKKEINGVAGKPGAAGNKATVDFSTISKDDFIAELHKYGVDSLGGEQPAFTTLITLAPKTRPAVNDAGPARPSENTTR